MVLISFIEKDRPRALCSIPILIWSRPMINMSSMYNSSIRKSPSIKLLHEHATVRLHLVVSLIGHEGIELPISLSGVLLQFVQALLQHLVVLSQGPCSPLCSTPSRWTSSNSLLLGQRSHEILLVSSTEPLHHDPGLYLDGFLASLGFSLYTHLFWNALFPCYSANY